MKPNKLCRAEVLQHLHCVTHARRAAAPHQSQGVALLGQARGLLALGLECFAL